MKKQVIVIHGADSFDTYEEYLSFLKDFKINFERMKKGGWKDSLREKLGKEFEVITPFMPNRLNAKYLEWKIWFEKLIPFFEEEVILVGHSTGGIFLVKYLSENAFPKRVKATFLVAACYDDTDSAYSLGDFILPEDLSDFRKQAGKIFLYQSKDDKTVPFADFDKYRKAFPEAIPRIFEDRGHFGQEEFPELVEDVKNL
jgi:hypothetical protein